MSIPFCSFQRRNTGHGDNARFLPGVAAVHAPPDRRRADLAGGLGLDHKVQVLGVMKIPGDHQRGSAGPGLGDSTGIRINGLLQLGPAFVIPGHKGLPGAVRGRGPDDGRKDLMNQETGIYLGLVFAGKGIADIPKIPDPADIL